MPSRALSIACVAVVLCACGGGTSPPTAAEQASLVAALAKCRARAELPVAGELPSTVDGASVTVTGPSAIIERVLAFERVRRGCETSLEYGQQGFAFGWGDDPDGTQRVPEGVPANGACPGLRSHHYSVPGTYHIIGSLFHPGPDDALVDEWSGRTTVTIAGPTPEETELEVLPDLDGTVHHREAVVVRWRWHPNRPLAIDVAVVADGGMVIGSEVACPSAYVGEGEQWVVVGRAREGRPDGPITVRPRIRLYDGTSLVLERIGTAFTYAP